MSHILQLAEVPLPVRFIFIYLVPPQYKKEHLEVGRTMATLLSNPVRKPKFDLKGQIL